MIATMTEAPVQEQIRDFAIELLNESGGMVEWDSKAGEGAVLVSPEVGQCFGQSSESFALTVDPARLGLCMSLGSEFLDGAGRALDRFVPARGSFKLNDLPVKKKDFQQAVDAAFGWQNARARVKQSAVMEVPYHSWWFHAVLHSEDTWESLIQITLNSNSRLPIDLGTAIESMDVSSSPTESAAQLLTLENAARLAEQQAMLQATSFFDRIDQRLQRDRKRLREYYTAISREASTPNRRTKTIPSSDEIESRERAVKLELKRKLAELEDRYLFEATVKPIAFVECVIPSVAIEVEIQRKSATRTFRVYWNGLLKVLEPLQCSRCGIGGFNFWFTNEKVEPICKCCHGLSAAT